MLAELYNVFSSPQELARWSFHNQDEHVKIIQSISSQSGLLLADYILDPMPDLRSENMKDWSYRHQAAHTAFTGALGIAGSDLTDVDWTKEDQVESWIFTHASEHVQAQKALGYAD